jgi:hypothetical protein
MLNVTEHICIEIGNIWEPGALFVRVKRSGREADRSPPSSAEVNAWSYLHSSIGLHGVMLS